MDISLYSHVELPIFFEWLSYGDLSGSAKSLTVIEKDILGRQSRIISYWTFRKSFVKSEVIHPATIISFLISMISNQVSELDDLLLQLVGCHVFEIIVHWSALHN